MNEHERRQMKREIKRAAQAAGFNWEQWRHALLLPQYFATTVVVPGAVGPEGRAGAILPDAHYVLAAMHGVN